VRKKKVRLGRPRPYRHREKIHSTKGGRGGNNTISGVDRKKKSTGASLPKKRKKSKKEKKKTEDGTACSARSAGMGGPAALPRPNRSGREGEPPSHADDFQGKGKRARTTRLTKGEKTSMFRIESKRTERRRLDEKRT